MRLPPPSPPNKIILLCGALNLVMNYADSLLKCKDPIFSIFSFGGVTAADGSDCDMQLSK